MLIRVLTAGLTFLPMDWEERLPQPFCRSVNGSMSVVAELLVGQCRKLDSYRHSSLGRSLPWGCCKIPSICPPFQAVWHHTDGALSFEGAQLGWVARTNQCALRSCDASRDPHRGCDGLGVPRLDWLSWRLLPTLLIFSGTSLETTESKTSDSSR